ncbi:MAG: rod shape-determining protein MreC [Solirubrobacterales bacterium]
MYKKSVRRRRAVLGLLVGLSIALLTVYFGESASGGLHAVQRGFLEVLAPLQEGASRALKPVRDFGGWVGDVFDAKSDNKKLRREVERLRAQLAAAETAGSDGEQLEALASFNGSSSFPDGYQSVKARVIGRSPTVWYSTITIDKGSSAGVRANQPVVTGDGLAGRVSDVSGDAAQVTLITDHSSGVSAQVVPNGANGLVKATVGDPDDLLLDFVERGRPVRTGSTVITSGWKASKLESLFPRGIPIGTVTSIDATERELYQRVHLHPFADLRNASVVEVIVPANAGDQRAQARP